MERRNGEVDLITYMVYVYKFLKNKSLEFNKKRVQNTLIYIKTEE